MSNIDPQGAEGVMDRGEALADLNEVFLSEGLAIFVQGFGLARRCSG